LSTPGHQQKRGSDKLIERLDLILEAEGDTPNRYKASKQADVLMLLYLLSAEELTATLNRLDYPFDPTMIPATVDYYLARTTHGSTLSHVVHAWVLARANRRASWHLFREALDADLSDRQNGTTGEGIHLGAMAATADILQRCYPGLQTRDDALRLHPVLPDPLTHLTFDLRYRGHRLHIHIRHGNISVYALPSAAPPVTVIIDDEPHLLCSGAQLTVDLPARRHTRPSPRREHHAPRTDGGDAG
jgi:trehalose/maltose hydrolase-like predicted phosphorylase